MGKFILIAIGGFLALLIMAAAFVISVRNGLITRDETVKTGWAEIDNQLQRRADLIPNLVNTVKGYAAHEKNIFETVAEARGKLMSAQGPQQKAEAGAALDGALGRLLAIAENYPMLKADTNFIRLQDELAGTENRISVARTRYNASVLDFNAAIRRFPGSVFAPSLGFESAQYFQVEDRAKVAKPPEVKF
ncbi:MAG: LemA family protein [Lentisphaerae bacterium GWF2_52_8]|nr:MAG: LemA family protein [Lentisphaerae bacterium GWF2_52_8]